MFIGVLAPALVFIVTEVICQLRVSKSVASLSFLQPAKANKSNRGKSLFMTVGLRETEFTNVPISKNVKSLDGFITC